MFRLSAADRQAVSVIHPNWLRQVEQPNDATSLASRRATQCAARVRLWRRLGELDPRNNASFKLVSFLKRRFIMRACHRTSKSVKSGKLGGGAGGFPLLSVSS
jgi:hypothetical protein